MEEEDEPYYEHYNFYLIYFYFLICRRDQTLCSLGCLRNLLKNLYWDYKKHWYSKERKNSLLASKTICVGHRIREGEISQVMAAGSHKSCLLRKNCVIVYGRDSLLKSWFCVAEYLRKSESNADFILKWYFRKGRTLFFFFQWLNRRSSGQWYAQIHVLTPRRWGQREKIPLFHARITKMQNFMFNHLVAVSYPWKLLSLASVKQTTKMWSGL